MAKPKQIPLKLIIYILTFMLSMIGFELILEQANSEFHDVDSFAAVSTLFQFGICSILPLLLSVGNVIKTFPRNKNDLLKYIQLSIIVYGATFQATRSIKYVRYPTKVVFKSAKLIPTMIVSTIINKGEGNKFSFNYDSGDKPKKKSIGSEINDDNNNKSTKIILLAVSHKVTTTTLQHVATRYSMIDIAPWQ